MDDIYKDNILDHYQNPRNYGHLDKPDYISEEENILCGDRIRMEIIIKSPSPRLVPASPARLDSAKRAGRRLWRKNSKCKIIDNIKFSGEGCAISIASASMLTGRVKGMDTGKVKKLITKDMLSLLGIALTPVRLKCALLPLEVLHKALGKDNPPLAKSK